MKLGSALNEARLRLNEAEPDGSNEAGRLAP